MVQRFERIGVDALEGIRPLLVDHATGLEWQGCAAGLGAMNCNQGVFTPHSWEQALSYCEGLNWAGQTDWTLPDIVQLWSVTDNRVAALPLDSQLFPALPAGNDTGLWSSTTHAAAASEAWELPMAPGLSNARLKSANTNLTLCVRHR